MTESGQEEVNAELESLITYFRNRVTELDDNEVSNLPVMADFRPPCQLELFWMDEPFDYQIMIKTRDNNRPDKEIIVNGPYSGPAFVPKIDEILDEPRWQQPAVTSRFRVQEQDQHRKRRAQLVGPLRRTISEIRGQPFANHHPRLGAGERLPDTNWFYRLSGNIANCDVEEFIDEKIADARSDGPEETDTGETIQQSDGSDTGDSSEDVNRLTGYGTYIFGPVWLGGPPDKEFQEEVFDRPSIGTEFTFDGEFAGRKVLGMRSGYLFVESDEPETALKIFNSIFGTAVFLGYRWRAVQRNGLDTVKTNPEDESYSTSGSVSIPRGLLGAPGMPESTDSIPLGAFRRNLATGELEEILNMSESIYTDEQLREKVISLLHALTHYLDDEHTPAFILTWMLLEQHLNQLLDRYLKSEEDVNNERRSTITEANHWYASNKIELAEIIDAIDRTEYEDLTRFRKKRNDIVHEMADASESDAEEILNLASKLLRSEFPEEFKEPRSIV